MDWLGTLKTVAPTVASALGGPLAGAAVTALANVIGGEPTAKAVQSAIEDGKLTAEQVAEIKKLEIQYQAQEKEMGFKFAELAFQDRDSARKANVAGGTQKYLFWLSILLLVVCIGSEVYVLFNGLPQGASELVIGRVLGLLDSAAMLVLSYWYGTSAGSAQKTELLAAK